MGVDKGFDGIIEERKNLSFFKVFQSADLSSETMRAFPYSFITRVSDKDFSYKMVIRSEWGSSWEVGVSKNPRFYYMEKFGWNKFVSDNGLGENEFVSFTHTGNMCFNVNIYEHNGKEILIPRKLQRIGSSSEVKKEPGESNYKDVKKEEEIGESPGEVREKRAEGSRTSKRKRVVSSVGIGESSGGVKLKGRKKKDEEKSKKKIKSTVPKFTIMIRRSYLKFLRIPTHFFKHCPASSEIFTIRHKDGNHSWEVLCLVRKKQAIFSSGWIKLVKEYPLSVDDICTFKLINPTEFLLVVSKKNPRGGDHFIID